MAGFLRQSGEEVADDRTERRVAGFGITIQTAMNHREATSIRSRLSELRKKGLIFGSRETGYRLTNPGYTSAVAEIGRLQEKA